MKYTSKIEVRVPGFLREALEMSHDEATQACLALFQTLGEHYARSIMAHTVAMGLDPDTMEGMIYAVIDDFCRDLRAAGSNDHDVDLASKHLYLVLVKEGGRIARAMTWEQGHA